MKIDGPGDILNWFNGDFQTQQFQLADEPSPLRLHILISIKIVSTYSNLHLSVQEK